jgi:hypothetical protein
MVRIAEALQHAVESVFDNRLSEADIISAESINRGFEQGDIQSVEFPQSRARILVFDRRRQGRELLPPLSDPLSFALLVAHAHALRSRQGFIFFAVVILTNSKRAGASADVPALHHLAVIGVYRVRILLSSNHLGQISRRGARTRSPRAAQAALPRGFKAASRAGDKLRFVADSEFAARRPEG